MNQTFAKRLVRCQLEKRCVGEKVFFIYMYIGREPLIRSYSLKFYGEVVAMSLDATSHPFLLPLTAMTHKFLCCLLPYIYI